MALTTESREVFATQLSFNEIFELLTSRYMTTTNIWGGFLGSAMLEACSGYTLDEDRWNLARWAQESIKKTI